MLRFLTAGESHGPQLSVIVEGMPAGLALSSTRDIDPDLRRRQGGHGRGGRQKIERDVAGISAGVRGGTTLGSPISLTVANRDWENWKGPMQIEAAGFTRRPVTRVRPGHADLAGVLKYDFDDARNVLERASARETAARVAVGAVARTLLRAVGITVVSYTRSVGDVAMPHPDDGPWGPLDAAAIEASPVRCPDPVAGLRMIAAIDGAKAAGDTLGGVSVVVATGVMPGLGSHVHWDRKLDGRLAGAICSIPSVKAVELGAGVPASALPGSRVHDSPVWHEAQGFSHASNRQGGLTGGITNGASVWVQAHFKPIATLLKPLRSVDMRTHEEINAHYERSDVCVVPAGGVVAEAMVAWTMAEAVVEKFGGDSMRELRRNVAGYRRQVGGM